MTRIATNEFFDVSINHQKNRLYTTVRKFWNDKVMDNYLKSMGKAISSMRKNFTVVVDLRGLKTLPPKLAERSKNMMMELNKAGMYKVAEILPESAIAKMQLNQSTASTKMPNKQFGSIEEGEKWLDAEIRKL